MAYDDDDDDDGTKVHFFGTHRIPGVQADFVGVFEQWEAFLFVQDPFLPFAATVRHCSEDDLGDFESRASKPGSCSASTI